MTRTIEQAKELIESLRPIQEDETSDYTFPCPRCGHDCMDKNQWAMLLGFDNEGEDDDQLFDEQRCRVCGCTWDNACEGGCYWVEDDLCSKCAEKMQEEKRL